MTRTDDVFKVSEYAVSETLDYTKHTMVEDGLALTVVDTVGLGDTELSEQKVLYRLADACWAVKEGFHQIFFVTSGRMTEEEIMCFDLLRTVIFDQGVCGYITIIRTKVEGYMDVKKCNKDVDLMRNSTKMYMIDKVKDHKPKDEIMKVQLEEMDKKVKLANDTLGSLKEQYDANKKEFNEIKGQNQQRGEEILQLQNQILQKMEDQRKMEEEHRIMREKFKAEKERGEKVIAEQLEETRILIAQANKNRPICAIL
eukprot:gene12150-14217_t